MKIYIFYIFMLIFFQKIIDRFPERFCFKLTEKELEYMLNKVEGLLQSKNMQTKKAYFRQEMATISCFPLMQNEKCVKEIARRNILTSGLVGTYPFISSSIFDENGILMVKYL